jgi:cytochrome c553
MGGDMWRQAGCALLAAAGWAAALAHAGDAAPARVRELAAACITCHAAAAGKRDEVPGFAGKSEAELLRSLMDFRSGTSAAVLMPQLVRGYSTEELAALAGFLARHPVP